MDLSKGLCKCCDGFGVVVTSDMVPVQWYDVGCPVCNLEVYLVNYGITQGKSREAINALKKSLDEYRRRGNITQEKVDDLVRQAHDLASRIRETPSFKDELIKKERLFFEVSEELKAARESLIRD